MQVLPSHTLDNSCARKLDRLGWSEGFTIAPYGVRVGVRTNSREALAHAESLLLPDWERVEGGPVHRLFSLRQGPPAARAGVENYHLLYDSILRVARTLDLREALQTLDRSLHLLIGATAAERIFIHAGVVGWNGKAILLPGASMAGKSTLVNRLVQAGATFYSDEYAVLDDQGLVHPYLKPMSLRDSHSGGPALISQSPPPIPVGALALTHFQAGCRRPLRSLSTSKAALGLFGNALAAALEPERVLAYIGSAMASDPLCFEGPRGDAQIAAASLLGAL